MRDMHNISAKREPAPAPSETEADADEIHRMICLSTAHISEESAALMDSDGASLDGTMPVHYRKGLYGYLVYVNDDPHSNEEQDYSYDVRAVLDYARARGCGWVMLDQDGPVVDGLKTWEW